VTTYPLPRKGSLLARLALWLYCATWPVSDWLWARLEHTHTLPEPDRAELARQLNADRVVENLDDLPRDAFDVVIDATGAIPLMQRSPDFARHGGTVLLFGVPPAGQRMELEAFPIFRKGLTILSSFTSRRNSFQAVSLLATRQIQVEPLISHQMPLRDFPRALQLLEQKLPNVRKVMILPND